MRKFGGQYCQICGELEHSTWHNAAARGGVGTVEYANLGRSGLSVSRLCLGTMNFGPEASDRTPCRAVLRVHTAVAAGTRNRAQRSVDRDDRVHSHRTRPSVADAVGRAAFGETNATYGMNKRFKTSVINTVKLWRRPGRLTC